MCITCTECKPILGLHKQVVSWALPSLSLVYLTAMGTYVSQMPTQNYTESYLCHVGQATITAYGTYHLDFSVRSHVISLDIRRQPSQQKKQKIKGKYKPLLQETDHSKEMEQLGRLNINWCITVSNLIVIKKEPITSTCFHLACINTMSISNKIHKFQHYVVDSSVDDCTILESWLKEDDEYSAKEVPPDG